MSIGGGDCRGLSTPAADVRPPALVVYSYSSITEEGLAGIWIRCALGWRIFGLDLRSP